MTTIKKMDKEFKAMNEPKDLFIFNFNKDNEDHIKICKFISMQVRRFDDERLQMFCSDERVCNLTNATKCKNGGDEEK